MILMVSWSHTSATDVLNDSAYICALRTVFSVIISGASGPHYLLSAHMSVMCCQGQIPVDKHGLEVAYFVSNQYRRCCFYWVYLILLLMSYSTYVGILYCFHEASIYWKPLIKSLLSTPYCVVNQQCVLGGQDVYDANIQECQILDFSSNISKIRPNKLSIYFILQHRNSIRLEVTSHVLCTTLLNGVYWSWQFCRWINYLLNELTVKLN